MRKQKKRKAFPTPKAVANNQVDDAAPGPSYISDVVLPPTNTCTKQKSIYKDVKNKSQEKIKNSPLVRNVGRTRSEKRKLNGVKSNEAKQRSEGYKLIDINLLEKCLNNAVICKNCFSKKGKMELYDRPSNKKRFGRRNNFAMYKLPL